MMSLQDTGPETDLDDTSFDAVLSYDWAGDEEFQGGLHTILANATTPAQAKELTLQAKCFFYSRQSNIPISFDLFKEYLARKGHGNPSGEAVAAVEGRIDPRESKSPFRPSELHTPGPSNPNRLQIFSEDPPTPSGEFPGPPPPTPVNLQISSAEPPPTPSAFFSKPPPNTPITPSVPSSPGNEKPPYPTSFAHIVELITTGQPIPGIREIPNKISDERPSESVQIRRKKPWEAGSDAPSPV